MLALGVTGDVGAGKSTLTRFWREMGASVLDADEIVRGLWKRPDVIGDGRHGGQPLLQCLEVEPGTAGDDG